MCACLRILEEYFLRIFVTFENQEMCEIVLIISGSTEYEFSGANFIELSKCSVILAAP